MAGTADKPLDGEDLAALRAEIDALQAIPEEEMLNPLPHALEEREPTPAPTDAIGSEDWDDTEGDEPAE
ncbi:hypothetical protein ASD65_04740 [Microbacterium sp. Root61]|uniref:hypothetical protein n=1 Tax=Microbacterium sp. Root61 TaxID=1736570 RepID=UPI0006F25155|nr:hypothetical protein [Microbacterium sp. Root61]KRA23804.1 hypothetical protein ASD65_04740 [Microbacterium sp. Root61]